MEALDVGREALGGAQDVHGGFDAARGPRGATECYSANRTGSGWLLSGTAVFHDERGPVSAAYRVEIDAGWRDDALAAKWENIRASRERVTETIEPLRRDKVIRSSNEAKVRMPDAELGIDADGLPRSVGFQPWLNTLNADPSNFRHMIFGFLFSTEYRQRFGP